MSRESATPCSMVKYLCRRLRFTAARTKPASRREKYAKIYVDSPDNNVAESARETYLRRLISSKGNFTSRSISLPIDTQINSNTIACLLFARRSRKTQPINTLLFVVFPSYDDLLLASLHKGVFFLNIF